MESSYWWSAEDFPAGLLVVGGGDYWWSADVFRTGVEEERLREAPFRVYDSTRQSPVTKRYLLKQRGCGPRTACLSDTKNDCFGEEATAGAVAGRVPCGKERFDRRSKGPGGRRRTGRGVRLRGGGVVRSRRHLGQVQKRHRIENRQGGMGGPEGVVRHQVE